MKLHLSLSVVCERSGEGGEAVSLHLVSSLATWFQMPWTNQKWQPRSHRLTGEVESGKGAGRGGIDGICKAPLAGCVGVMLLDLVLIF